MYPLLRGWVHSSTYSVLHLSSNVCLATFSLMFSHSCLVAGAHFLPVVLEQFSSSTYLGTWLHFLLVTVEHMRSETSLVWILGTREQTRLDFCWQSLTGISWQDWRLSSWQSTLGTWMHLISGTLEHS